MRRLPTPTRPGFEHVHRFLSAEGETLAKILPGELYVTEPPELITTLLGSCVAACIRDPTFGVGGMNHFMLPDSDPLEGADRQGRYGAYAMEQLINEVIKAGGRRERLEVKIFGGGRVGTSRARIGEENVAFVERYLAREGFKVSARHVGGSLARKLIYDPGSGRARVMVLPPLELGRVWDRERAYQKELNAVDVSGGIELF